MSNIRLMFSQGAQKIEIIIYRRLFLMPHAHIRLAKQRDSGLNRGALWQVALTLLATVALIWGLLFLASLP